jgi:hypothetical protein
MSSWSDMDYEMHPVALDMDTADRLLAGAVAPEDAPPGYAEVARLLEVVSARPTEDDELHHEAAVVAQMALAVRSSLSTHSPRRSFMPFALSRPRMTAVLVAAVLACTVGLASASALPGAAQEIASEMLAKVGISVSGPNDNAGTHPDVRGNSTVTPSDAGKGSEISDLARTTELSGIDKGAAISGAASDGKSKAGTQGGGSGASAPVATPNSGGTGTADIASGGKSSTGTGTAGTASGGHSSSGSGNAGTGQETADNASGGHSGAGQTNKP